MAQKKRNILQRLLNLFNRNNIRGRYMFIIIPIILVVLAIADIFIYNKVSTDKRTLIEDMSRQTMEIQASNIEN
ncbi:MAG: hypothetical protein J5595_07965, partial [Bacteroidales bacterium]|nr:hypothetical protein [Bacteroidales bacterium]